MAEISEASEEAERFVARHERQFYNQAWVDDQKARDAAIRAEARRQALLEAASLCDVCGRPSGGCCAVVIDSLATLAVNRYREHIRALLAKR